MFKNIYILLSLSILFSSTFVPENNQNIKSPEFNSKEINEFISPLNTTHEAPKKPRNKANIFAFPSFSFKSINEKWSNGHY